MSMGLQLYSLKSFIWSYLYNISEYASFFEPIIKGLSCIHPEKASYLFKAHLMQLKTIKTNTCWSRSKNFNCKGFLQGRKRRNMTIEVVYQPPARRWVPADSIISTSAGSHPMLMESSKQNRSIGINCTIGKFLFLFTSWLLLTTTNQYLLIF